MATNPKRSALEIESWLFDPGDDEQAASKLNSEVTKQQTGLSETRQPDSQEVNPKPKKIRFNPRMISRFL